MIFFKSVRCAENSNIVDFEALENDVCCGKCRLVIDGMNAEIKFLSSDETKPYIFEGLIKSSFNYACMKNCYMGYIKTDTFSHLLEKMGFQAENGVYFNDIPTIIQGNCCKNK